MFLNLKKKMQFKGKEIMKKPNIHFEATIAFFHYKLNKNPTLYMHQHNCLTSQKSSYSIQCTYVYILFDSVHSSQLV